MGEKMELVPATIQINEIGNLIYTIRDKQVMLDGKMFYHIGASIKDTGKKCFGISLINDSSIVLGILNRLKAI